MAEWQDNKLGDGKSEVIEGCQEYWVSTVWDSTLKCIRTDENPVINTLAA